MAQGYFITFEGIEGSGKTTQIKLLHKYLVEQGREVEYTREPGGTEIGRKIREILLDPRYSIMDYKTEILLYAADRAQDMRENIIPALKSGKIILSDRFVDSNLAYQAYGRGLDYKMVYSINNWVIDPHWPDLTIILDIDIKQGLMRARSISEDQAGDRLEREVDSFHQRVKEGYLKMAEKDRFVVVDAGGEPDDVHSQIKKIVSRRLL
ncbi:MAG: dTMP kinase [Bacillota bacterium]